MLRNPVFRLVNNWLHDVGTGLWAASLLALWVIDSRIQQVIPYEPATEILTEVEWLMFWLMVGALIDITLTGIVRLVYWRAETPPEQLASKRPALIGKHIAFLVVYGGGTAWALWLLGVL